MFKSKIKILFFTMLFLTVALTGRLVYLSLGNDTVMAQNQISHAKVVVDNPRGTIFDRNGEPLSNDTKTYKIVVTNNTKLVSEIYKFFGKETGDSIVEQIRIGGPLVLSVPCNFKCDGTTVFQCYETNTKFPFSIHTLGYTNIDLNGVCGIQKAFNDFLKSDEETYVRFESNGQGNAVFLSESETKISQNPYKKGVITTIDKKIQQICDSEKIKQGAIVVSDCFTGEILGLSSFPTFSLSTLEDAVSNSLSPMINRCLFSYDLGSIFKIVVCIAALENGYSTDFSYNCTGKIQCGQTFNCHKEDGHGSVNMQAALCQSCNTYFINLAQNLGYEAIYNVAEKLGLDKSFFLCDELECCASLPQKDTLCTPAALANFSIGQGGISVSPVTVSNIINAVIDNGCFKNPKLIIGLQEADGYITPFENDETKIQIMSKSTADTIKKMLIDVINNGTGASAKPNFRYAGGKTATAETGIQGSDGAFVNQTWFSGFYPADNPKYTITVLCENGSSGSYDAAPIFKSICNKIELFL